eukprot:2092421-Rhodomonas_salina.1
MACQHIQAVAARNTAREVSGGPGGVRVKRVRSPLTCGLRFRSARSVEQRALELTPDSETRNNRDGQGDRTGLDHASSIRVPCCEYMDMTSNSRIRPRYVGKLVVLRTRRNQTSDCARSSNNVWMGSGSCVVPDRYRSLRIDGLLLALYMLDIHDSERPQMREGW